MKAIRIALPFLASFALFSIPAQSQSSPQRWIWNAEEFHLVFDRATLAENKITVEYADANYLLEESTLSFESDGSLFLRWSEGEAKSLGRISLSTANGERFDLGDFAIKLSPSGAGLELRDRQSFQRPVFITQEAMIDFSPARKRFYAMLEISISKAFADQIGQTQLAGLSIGTLILDGSALAKTSSIINAGQTVEPVPDPQESSLAGPDVIVGDLHNFMSYTQVGGISPFAVGTTSCNIGGAQLNWIAETNQHPVIGQNLYRLKNSRFEQIGQSWLKHGFFALSGTLCSGPGGCSGDPSGDHLGVGCSDPYDASLNGNRNNLGPRSQVNPSTGVYPYPFSAPAWSTTIDRRLQVFNTDLNPTLNSGALYFAEGQYVAADDAALGDKNNNASYRRVSIGGSDPNYSLNTVAGQNTQRQLPALRAWIANDTGVNLVTFNVAGDGHFELAYKVSSIGGGMWHYEYALYNMNSDRSAGSFSIPYPNGVTLSNVGFHDVHSHSGEPYSNTDWTMTPGATDVSWATTDYSTNPNANALRWGTLYNFRFDSTHPPQIGSASIGLFKPGSPSSLAGNVQVPGLDCNGNEVVDSTDISSAMSEDCNANAIPDECEAGGNSDCDNDGDSNLCELFLGTATDNNSNGIPDNCEISAPFLSAVGSRYLQLMPPMGSTPIALRLDSPDLPCLLKYVQADGSLGDSPVYMPGNSWNVYFLSGLEIIPATEYHVRADTGSGVSNPAIATTWNWGELTNDTSVDVDDILCSLATFAGQFSTCSIYAGDLKGASGFNPNLAINLDDLLAVIGAFANPAYTGPNPCP